MHASKSSVLDTPPPSLHECEAGPRPPRRPHWQGGGSKIVAACIYADGRYPVGICPSLAPVALAPHWLLAAAAAMISTKVGLSDAPPTKKPSTSLRAMSSLQFP